MSKNILHAIQEVDDLFAWNLTEMEETELAARISKVLDIRIHDAKAEEREACASLAESMDRMCCGNAVYLVSEAIRKRGP